MSNFERLRDGGMIPEEFEFSEVEIHIIDNHLTEEEVECLLSIRRKFGGRGSMITADNVVF